MQRKGCPKKSSSRCNTRQWRKQALFYIMAQVIKKAKEIKVSRAHVPCQSVGASFLIINNNVPHELRVAMIFPTTLSTFTHWRWVHVGFCSGISVTWTWSNGAWRNTLVNSRGVWNGCRSLNTGLSPLRIGRLRPRSGPLDRILYGSYTQMVLFFLL